MRRRAGTSRVGGRRTSPHQGRFLAVVLLVAVGFAALVGRLGQVQLVGHDDFRAAASALDTRTLVVPALRGRILDREGRVLADNRASTVVTIERRVIADRPDRGASEVRDVASLLGLPAADLLGRTWLCGERGAPAAPACWAGSPQVPVPLAEDVDPTRALSLVEQPTRFPGVAVESQPVRVYPRPLGVSAAQALGYLGQVRSDEVGGDRALVADDLVGRSGLEQQYDSVLRGVPGRTVVAVDARGLVTGVVSRTAPVPGRDLVTSLDVRVQAAAERALATQMAKARKRGWPADSGAVVVLDPRSGAVAALASAPSYDPNIWTGGISQADYAALTATTAGTPLLSRAIGVELAPASTMKPASVAAAVRAGNPLDGSYDCPTTYRIGDRVFHNHETRGRGLISFRKAIEISCDTVFYAVAYRSWQAQGGFSATSDARDPFVAVSTGLGLGSRTGIDLPGEAAGRIPDRAWKKASWEATKAESCRRARTGYPEVGDRKQGVYLKEIAVENCDSGYLLRPGDAANFSIGQGDVGVTPLQVRGHVCRDRQRWHGRHPARRVHGRRPGDRRGRGRRGGPQAQGPPQRARRLLPAGRAAGCRDPGQRAQPVPLDAGLAGRGQDGHRRGRRQAGHLVVRVVRPGERAEVGRLGRRGPGRAGCAHCRTGRPGCARDAARPPVRRPDAGG